MTISTPDLTSADMLVVFGLAFIAFLSLAVLWNFGDQGRRPPPNERRK